MTEGVGGTGVVGILKNGDGPLIMLRADMDGLPVEENIGPRLCVEGARRSGRTARHSR